MGAVGGLSDGQLLGCFATRRDEAAFEALIQRHGPMVWGVCRRILRDHHEAEEAFSGHVPRAGSESPAIAHRGGRELAALRRGLQIGHPGESKGLEAAGKESGR